MDNSRPSSPEAPPQDLWSSILDSVSSSRSTPSKQVLVLGQPSSGKSSIVSALLQKPLEDDVKEDQRSDFALGYDWGDVRDDADEDTLARLSVYTVPSPAQSYTALLPHFLPPRTSLPHTLVMIALDWTRPWTFVEELETWLQWIEKWAKGDGSRDLEITREENRERWQAHLQHYTEPSAEPLPTTSSLSDTVLPLGPGTFTHNAAGVPIIVTCTKADLIDEGSAGLGPGSSGMGAMVKGNGGEWEERTDGVMQVLRTICLKYGAALFYTTPMPQTLQTLRQYTLHLLFTPPAPSLAFTAGTDAPAPVRNPFPFQQKPNALDRDKIVVPAGWDSWGKITVLREGFDPKSWGEAWERDIDYAEGETGEPGAKRLYSALVPDNSIKPPPLPPFNNPIPEQQFLAKNFDENSKKADRDPRGAFRNPNESVAAGVVGPMGSSSFNLPNVERALTEMEGTVGGVGAVPLAASVSGDAARRLQGRTAARPPPSTLAVPPAGIPGRSGAPSPTLSSASPSPGGEKTENHEMLHNFFQDLLRRSKNTTSTTGTNGAANGAANGAEKDAGAS
ncbi:hypothetical protein CERSUDRAFT_111182 [Gelatoporia subvermispora B]|uniref:Dynein light intermediate chain n=1 Tax=Ceriporiopsis subvermispora (strain B) TaxID=914234 RepID=M2RQ74_CERS8|nr:hypothetical protein CERSUDRAFT_111182 [Gelatoporia subvermispora B]